LVALADEEDELEDADCVGAAVELEDDVAGVEALDELDLDGALAELELLELAANQVSTPWWPLHAPFLVGAVV
jgi:hypothetical protein